MPSPTITLIGSLPKIKPEFLRCLIVYIVRGPEVLAQASVQENGSYSVSVSRQGITAPSSFGVFAIVGPAGMETHLEHLPNLRRVPLDRKHLATADKEFRIPTHELKLTDEILKLWWSWCKWYCVSGNIVGPNGCPVPGAEVTVCTVGFNLWGFTTTPEATANADPNGHFTACFCWCTCPFCFPCWPCWPLWWLCWPWWWEWDILYIIEALERVQGPAFSGLQAGSVLLQPDKSALIRGRGYPEARKPHVQFRPDSGRTVLIQRKFSDARIRALFPWWWWCCDDPNIIFKATQGPITIVDENPAVNTRWCLEEGSTVTLVANEQAITACPSGPPVAEGFAWTRVGCFATVDKIRGGYFDGFGGDTSDLPFAGTLDIYGGFGDPTVAYYQVNAGQWTGDPSRGGTPPGSSSPISGGLYNYAFIYDGVTFLLKFAGPIQMGPFSQGGLTNLYATQAARQAGPTPPGLAAFPAFNPGDLVLWAYEGRIVDTNGSALIGGASVGGVDLQIAGYDNALAPVPLAPNDPLTLEIDNTGLTTAHINSLAAFKADNSPAPLTNAGDCPAYDLGPGGYVQINLTVSDANGHLWEYELDAERGHGITDLVPPGVRGYSQPPGTFPPLPYQAPNTAQKSFAGGTEVMTYYPPEDCCYEFRIRAGKRITDGCSTPSMADFDFQTTTLKVSA